MPEGVAGLDAVGPLSVLAMHACLSPSSDPILLCLSFWWDLYPALGLLNVTYWFLSVYKGLLLLYSIGLMCVMLANLGRPVSTGVVCSLQAMLHAFQMDGHRLVSDKALTFNVSSACMACVGPSCVRGSV